jgi:hypothetical protein
MLGDVGAVTTKDKIQSKLTNRGNTCMFVGYTENHSRDVFRMLKLETKAIIHLRDIIWLHKIHKYWVKDKSMTIIFGKDDSIELSIGMRIKKVKIIRPMLSLHLMKGITQMKRCFLK